MPLPHLLNGTLRDHYILLFGAAGCIALLAGVVGAWIGGYLGARRALRTEQLNAPANQTAIQLTPIMQALDAISLEVERISEAQRFATKLLTERPPVVLPRVDQRSITPH
jgi:hypothetical protein